MTPDAVMTAMTMTAALWVLGEAALRGAVLVVLMAVALRMLRVRSGTVRHGAWTTALLSMLLMPALPSIVPAVEIPIPGFESPAPPVDASPAERSTPEVGGMGAGPAGLVAGAAAVTSAAGSGDAPTATARPDATSALDISWPAVVFGLYIIGVVVLLARMAAGWIAAVRLGRSGQRVRSWDRPVVIDDRVLESPHVMVPMTVGILSSRVLLPASWRRWSTGTLTAVLAHERAHVQRRDLLFAWLARINVCLFWFNPASWFVERQLTSTAEDAADESAVRATGHAADYARVLLDMAADVRRSRRRIAWHAMGMNGARGLEGRIDRLLRGEARQATRGQWLRAATASMLLLGIVIACQRATPPRDLEPDPEIARELAAREENTARTHRAWAMTADEGLALHARWRQTPDVDMADTLLRYYEPVHNGTWVASAPDWAARRREVALWAIEHHPGTTLARRANHVFSSSSRLPDPEGARKAEALWRQVAESQTQDARVLSTAASFYETRDPRLTERLLLRAQAIDPEGGLWTAEGVRYTGRWSSELARLYAQVLTGRTAYRLVPAGWSGAMWSEASIDVAWLEAFAQEIRARLDTTQDAALLAETGRAMTNVATIRFGAGKVEMGPSALGRSYLERALALDPDNAEARAWLLSLDQEQRWIAAGMVVPPPAGRTPQEALDALADQPEAERMVALSQLAAGAYMRGETHDYYVRHPDKVTSSRWTYTQAEADAWWDVSSRAAEQALDLAARLPDHPEAGNVILRANLAHGLLAFRRGDRQGALRGLAAAAQAPATDEIRYGLVGPLEYRLTDGLLTYGERETIARFYETIAKVRLRTRDADLAAAAAIRAGRMPEGYQRRLHSQSQAR